MNPRKLTFTLLALLASTLLSACDRGPSVGGTNDETSTLAFYLPNGKPAAGARVSIYGSADTGVAPRKQVVTNAKGEASLPVFDKGFYNLVVRDRDGNALFQDSLFTDGSALRGASDTLRATGILTGKVRVQPQHSPRIAWVQLLGAGVYANVDDSGRFTLDGVPSGRYTLAALTRVAEYTPTFLKVRAISDSTLDVGTIDLIYTGLPVVKNLEARFDTLAGLVHLRWDSVALRQTWHYNVYRNEQWLGQTVGNKWIDTVSDEYPADVPSEGRHTYRIALADAEHVGQRWESVSLQVISPYLYQEVKIDWQKRSELPWPSGLFRIDTADGKLVAWRSAEYGTSVILSGESRERYNTHRGWIEMWESSDSGGTWRKVIDSLHLAALPVRYQGKWWSVRRAIGALVSFDSKIDGWSMNSAGLEYSEGTIVTSSNGEEWDSVGQVSVGVFGPASAFRLDYWNKNLVLSAVCERKECGKPMKHELLAFPFAWNIRKDGEIFVATPASADSAPRVELAFMGKIMWTQSSAYSVRLLTELRIGNAWIPQNEMMSIGEQNSNGMTDFDMDWEIIELPDGKRLFAMELPQRMVSFDSTISVVHSVAWPGKGHHFEMLYGNQILSVSDAGVFLGRVLPDAVARESRGTWVRKTEVPVAY